MSTYKLNPQYAVTFSDVPLTPEMVAQLDKIKESIHSKICIELSFLPCYGDEQYTYSSAASDHTTFNASVAQAAVAQMAYVRDAFMTESALPDWITTGRHALALSLALAAQAFDHSIISLARYHRLGVWRYEKELA